MKRFLLRSFLTGAAFSIVITSFAFTNASPVVPQKSKTENAWNIQFKDAPEIKALSPEMMKLSIDQFLSLTPSKYKKLTGHKLGMKKSLELKAAQKLLKKKLMNPAAAEDLSKGLYIVLAIIGWGFLGLGLVSDWQGNDWWICLLLTFLCWLPGVIYALIKMKDYYK
jgi:uncharacterized membrane protein YqaE (UPF0057 family)